MSFETKMDSIITKLRVELRQLRADTLTKTGKAADSELLDGRDSSDFMPNGTNPSAGTSGRIIGVGGGTLNRHLTTGFYEGSGLTGAPNGSGDWWLIEVLAHSAGGYGTQYQRQVAHKMTGLSNSSPESWTRACVGGDPTVAGSWTPWRVMAEDTGWLVPTFESTFSDYGDIHACRYRRKNGVVYIKGLANSSSTASGTVFTLPVGFRPPSTHGHLYIGMTGGGARRFDVRPNGSGYAGQLIYSEPAASWNSVECSFPAGE